MKAQEQSSTAVQIAYAEQFGMAEKPFGLTPDPDFFFESRSHSEALRRLKPFIENCKGLALVYGDVGTGKTLVCRRLLNDLDGKEFNAALIINPLMDGREILLDISGQFGVSPPPLATRENMLEALTTFLHTERERGRTSVLAIDEAQLLSNDALNLLTELSSLDTPSGCSLHIVLFGQEEIATRLLTKDMEKFRRHITVTHYLQPFSRDEVGRYVRFRLSRAGSNGSISFSEDVLDSIYAISKGYPRIINGMCDQSLLLLAQSARSTVDRDILNRVLRNEMLSPPDTLKKVKLTGLALHRIALILAALLALYGLFLYLRPVLG